MTECTSSKNVSTTVFFNLFSLTQCHHHNEFIYNSNQFISRTLIGFI